MKSTWKSVERRVARQLGTERTGPTGTPQPDAETSWLCVEVKHRKSLPQWLTSALAQAKQHCNERQLGIAVLHEKHGRDSLVVMSFTDFVDWSGQTQEKENGE